MTENHFEPLKVQLSQMKSLRDMVTETLREAIMAGSLEPGEHLKERELSEKMGISTTPIKEALRILSHEGLVETIPRKGTYVSEAANSSIEEVLLLKANLEALCAYLAAHKMTDAEIGQLAKQVDVMRELADQKDAEKLQIVNSQFHALIRKGSKNPLIYKMVENVISFDQSFRKRALKQPVEIEEGFREHQSIFKAIKDRDADLAEKRMRAHIYRTAQNVLKHLGKEATFIK